MSACFNNLDVKIVSAHASISLVPDGVKHHSLVDVAIMWVLPNMTVVAPCDAIETERQSVAIAKKDEPCFIHFGSEAVPAHQY